MVRPASALSGGGGDRSARWCAGKYIGNRPVKIKKSDWKDRSVAVVREKEKEQKKMIKKLIG